MTHKFYKRIVNKKMVAQRFGDVPPDPKVHGSGWVEAQETDADVVAFRASVSVRTDKNGDVVEVFPSPVCPDGFQRMARSDPKVAAFESRMREAMQR